MKESHTIAIFIDLIDQITLELTRDKAYISSLSWWPLFTGLIFLTISARLEKTLCIMTCLLNHFITLS